MDVAAPAHATEDVLAALLHKLGSPLGAVLNHAHLLGRTAAAEDGADAIASAARRAATYVAGARRWLDALEDPGPAEAVDLADALRQAPLGIAEGAVRLRHAGVLPPVRVAPRALARMIQEVLANAIQAVASDVADIRVEAAVEGAHVRVRFLDDGPPWDAREADRAFALFTTLDPTSNRAGMGLPIVSALARAQGGWVEANGDDPAGARIELCLPAAS